MKRLIALAALLLAGTFSNTVFADDGLPGEISANVALTTNYVFRGITQTDDGPAIQGGFDYGQNIFYAGVWGSSIDFGDDTTMELDLYAGLSPTYNTVTFDVGFIYYAYPDSPELATGTQNFLEVYVGASAPVGPIEIGGTVAYSPEFYGEIGGAFYYQATAALDLSEETGIEGLVFDVSYGFSRFEDGLLGDDYDDYSVGVSVTAAGLDLGLRYYGTSGLSSNDDHISFTVSKSF